MYVWLLPWSPERLRPHRDAYGVASVAFGREQDHHQAIHSPIRIGAGSKLPLHDVFDSGENGCGMCGRVVSNHIAVHLMSAAHVFFYPAPVCLRSRDPSVLPTPHTINTGGTTWTSWSPQRLTTTPTLMT